MPLIELKKNENYFSKEIAGFCQKHVDSANSISTWRRVVQVANWKKGSDILIDFPKAKLIPSKRA